MDSRPPAWSHPWATAGTSRDGETTVTVESSPMASWEEKCWFQIAVAVAVTLCVCVCLRACTYVSVWVCMAGKGLIELIDILTSLPSPPWLELCVSANCYLCGPRPCAGWAEPVLTLRGSPSNRVVRRWDGIVLPSGSCSPAPEVPEEKLQESTCRRKIKVTEGRLLARNLEHVE